MLAGHILRQVGAQTRQLEVEPFPVDRSWEAADTGAVPLVRTLLPGAQEGEEGEEGEEVDRKEACRADVGPSEGDLEWISLVV